MKSGLLKTTMRAAILAALGGLWRTARVGAAGIRRDGTIVVARNGPAPKKEPRAHAEARLIRKLGRGALAVCVARTWADGTLALAAPCPRCANLLDASQCHSVFFSSGDGWRKLW